MQQFVKTRERTKRIENEALSYILAVAAHLLDLGVQLPVPCVLDHLNYFLILIALEPHPTSLAL